MDSEKNSQFHFTEVGFGLSNSIVRMLIFGLNGTEILAAYST